MSFRCVYPDDPHPLVQRVREKFAIYPLSQEWDDTVIQRVRGFQALNGLTPDGVLDEETVRLMAL